MTNQEKAQAFYLEYLALCKKHECVMGYDTETHWDGWTADEVYVRQPYATDTIDEWLRYSELPSGEYEAFNTLNGEVYK